MGFTTGRASFGIIKCKTRILGATESRKVAIFISVATRPFGKCTVDSIISPLSQPGANCFTIANQFEMDVKSQLLHPGNLT